MLLGKLPKACGNLHRPQHKQRHTRHRPPLTLRPRQHSRHHPRQSVLPERQLQERDDVVPLVLARMATDDSFVAQCLIDSLSIDFGQSAQGMFHMPREGLANYDGGR